MASISLEPATDATPIAFVRDGEYSGKILYLHEKETASSKKGQSIDANKYKTELASLKPGERTKMIVRLSAARDKGLEPDQLIGETAIGKQLYSRILADQKASKDINLESGHFELLPSCDPKKRDVFYIAGASGSGKSYIAKGIAEYYQKLFPNRHVYLISKLDADPGTLDKMKKPCKRISVQSLVDSPPTLEEFKDCMVIADDWDTFGGKEEKAVLSFIEDVAIMGRHSNTSILILSHYLTNFKKSRLMLLEATHFVLYPMSTSAHALNYLLKNYIGLDKDDVRDLRKLGRWICIKKTFPQYLVAANYAKLLHT